ncbi:putative Sel1 repeat-containing protein 1 [Lucilia cuprina]|uniref:Putative Sel1 repeat-containing protein 1 n=1 Tax=Lucilia cuprina TaxID=7375 RepID=A0A0L0BYV8_LUCCU|nr:cytochrome c oxidase assembly factor 7 homolog [Lucilia cuprina]KAI8117762.1 Cytochrome c oxidase assembly factor 7 like protein [Lucilia cuprina]KNC25176.1 putative Sel1 repeat-containing protein 1 [Lucilia cuprina]
MAYDLKKESDVKEYIEKLGVEYRFGCYSEKKPEVCHLLGDYLESIKKDFEKASKVYKSTCDDYGYAKSCFKFGNYSFLGKGKSGTKGDPRAAYSYYEKGCTLNDSDSCLHSGLLLVSRSMPKEIDRDVRKGLEFLTKSCDMNNATACFYLSGMHISGVQTKPEESHPAPTQTPAKESDYIVHKDMKKAFEFAYKACELRNMYACANLSQMYARGDGTEKNEKEAEKYKKMAMEMQDEIKKQQQTLQFQQGLKNPH